MARCELDICYLGGIQGVVLSLEKFLFGHRDQHIAPQGLSKWLRWVITFQIVCFSWIFFRAQSISAAFTMIHNLGHFQWSPDYTAAWIFLAILGGLGFAIDLQLEESGGEYLFQNNSPMLRYSAAVAAMVMLILFSAGDSQAFIYFRF